MALRKICKCCKRKREQHHLIQIGFAHNNGAIWICKDGERYYNGCNVTEWLSYIQTYNETMYKHIMDKKILFGL